MVFSNNDEALINKKLPKELLLRIFSFLDIVTLCRCAQVSKDCFNSEEQIIKCVRNSAHGKARSQQWKVSNVLKGLSSSQSSNL